LLLVGLVALPLLAGPEAARSPDRAAGPSAAAGGVSASTRGPADARAVPSVDSYIKGLTQFDASLMWGSLSDEALQEMQARGGSLEALQQGLDDAKRSGARYEGVTMIGDYPLQDGQRYLFYVLARRGFAGPDLVDQVYFVFTVDQDGKIANVV
jgi:hypothetical protein